MSGRSLWRAEGRSLDDKGWAPLRYWAMWCFGARGRGTLFYVILTPVWIGLRVAAWVAEFKRPAAELTNASTSAWRPEPARRSTPRARAG